MMLLGFNNGLGTDAIEDPMTLTVLTPFQDPTTTSAPLMPSKPMWLSMLWGVLSTVSAALSGYHGYKRNNSLGWGLGWFVLGGIFPVVTPTIAFAQGFGKRK